MTEQGQGQSADRVRIAVVDGVADVRLNRADKLNALDHAMFAAIADVQQSLSGMTGLRAVVLSGAGRGFCAGLDMASLAAGGSLSRDDLPVRSHGIANLFQQAAWGWHELAVPVIAAIHGVAFGGGFQIASGADIRIATPDSRLAIMEMKWGLVPDMAGMALWRNRVRDDVLRDLIYSAREFSGAEAQALGFVTRLADDPLAEALALAATIAAQSPDAVRGAKRLCNAIADADDAALLLTESAEQVRLLGSPNQHEAVSAGFERRMPRFVDG